MMLSAPQWATTRAEPAVTYVALADGGPYGVFSDDREADEKGVGVMTGPDTEAL